MLSISEKSYIQVHAAYFSQAYWLLINLSFIISIPLNFITIKYVFVMLK